MSDDTVYGYTACWKLSAEGRCRLPKNHDGECGPVPYAGDRVLTMEDVREAFSIPEPTFIPIIQREEQ
jgi:hypothetical protein